MPNPGNHVMCEIRVVFSHQESDREDSTRVINAAMLFLFLPAEVEDPEVGYPIGPYKVT